MRLLLDTHAVLWSVADSPRLSPAARAALSEAGVEPLLSAVSLFEITLKHWLGKLPEAGPFVRHHEQVLAGRSWTPLPLTLAHASAAGAVDHPHKDPFDRLLIAQARIERVPIVSNEALFDSFGVERIW